MKLFASDFDKTLYFNNEFKEKDLIAIEKFKKAGHLFGVCTGTYLDRVKASSIGHLTYDFHIATSGSIILYKDNILYEKCISYETLSSLFHTYNEMCKIWIHADFDVFITPKSQASPSQINFISSPEDVSTKKLRGISLGFVNDKDANINAKQIREKYNDIEVFQNSECLDIVAKDCTKGNAVKKFTEQIPVEKTYGIGDNYNDLPLLKMVDVSFTFHSSPKDLQDICTHVVDSVEEAIHIILNEK